jgi:hypothetical protein
LESEFTALKTIISAGLEKDFGSSFIQRELEIQCALTQVVILGQQSTKGVKLKRKLEKSLHRAIEKFQFLLEVQMADHDQEGISRFPKF